MKRRSSIRVRRQWSPLIRTSRGGVTGILAFISRFLLFAATGRPQAPSPPTLMVRARTLGSAAVLRAFPELASGLGYRMDAAWFASMPRLRTQRVGQSSDRSVAAAIVASSSEVLAIRLRVVCLRTSSRPSYFQRSGHFLIRSVSMVCTSCNASNSGKRLGSRQQAAAKPYHERTAQARLLRCAQPFGQRADDLQQILFVAVGSRRKSAPARLRRSSDQSGSATMAPSSSSKQFNAGR